MVQFPTARPRRLRENPLLRQLVQENRISPKNLVMPLFIRGGKELRKPIRSMPGIAQYSPDLALREAEAIFKAGIPAVLLFGISEEKDAFASAGFREDGIVQQVIQMIKREVPDLLLIADVCLCDYTDHGHCGIVHEENGKRFIDNDASLEVLSKIAGSLARSGADIIAPSDMMDGRIAAIRDELDAVGFKNMPILSYAAKYASSFYGPFREALESTPQFGDRRSYQMDPPNAREALREARLDIEEGADMLMVKPALPYLDILRSLRDNFDVPLAAYQVSGEYAAIKAAAAAGYLDERAVVLETWMAMKRAGADLLISYFAKDYVAALGD